MYKSLSMNESYELAAATLSCLGDGVISADLNGKIIYLNHIAEKIFELKATDLMGKDFYDAIKFYKADTKKRHEVHLYNVIKNNKICGLENNTIIITKNGTQKYVSATISSVKDENNNTIGVVVILRDITKLKTLEIDRLNEKNNLKAIFDSSPVGMITLNEHTLITEINDACLLYINKEREQVNEKNFGYSFSCIESLKYGCGYGPNCLYCDLRKAIESSIHSGKATSNFETCMTLSQNNEDNVYWFRASVAPIVVNGKRNSLITLIDITESKNREQVIIESRDYCNNILNQLPSLACKTDEQLKYNYVNKVWHEFTGIGFEGTEEYSWDNIIHPDDLNRYVGLRNEAMNKQDKFQSEVRIRRYDGKYRWCIVIDTPYYDLDGKFAGYLCSLYDITEQKEAEENLKRYRKIIDNARDSIFMFDLDGNILEANKSASEMYGYSRAELCSMRLHKIRENWGYTKEQMDTVYRTGLFFEAIHKRKDGSTFEVEISSQGIYFGEKQILFSIIRDITHLKQSELCLKSSMEAAEAANKAKSEFLANMSHEIRTPINGMVGMLDLTLLTELSYEQKDNLLTAKECANSLLNIINDILDFSKMEAGKMSIENVSFDIRKLIEELVKMYSPRVEEKGLELNYTFNSSIPQFLIGDPNRIRQIINNMLSNAIKFTNNGTILISVKNMNKIDDEVEIKFSVTDTGIGIAEDDMDHLFQSFSQIEQSYTKKYGGTGLGLAISKNLVELMGGSIGVTSKIGQGSEFFFHLKFKIGDAVKVTTDNFKCLLIPNKQLRILLAEDDHINQKVISKMLKEKGYRVEIASNGTEVLLLYKQKSFDIILMDIRMPEMNGLEATQKIREMESEGNHIPIIALTAYALKEDSERFLNLGMDGYISKPIDMNNLFYQIEKITSSVNASDLSMPNSVSLTKNGDILFMNKTSTHSNSNLNRMITEISNYIKILDTAMENDDLMRIENIAHDIKTLSNEFDSIEMKDIAFKIELASRRGNLEAAKNDIKRMKSEFQILTNKVL